MRRCDGPLERSRMIPEVVQPFWGSGVPGPLNGKHAQQCRILRLVPCRLLSCLGSAFRALRLTVLPRRGWLGFSRRDGCPGRCR
eukprot:scaffold292178_cov27-Tisochrysis_lutea.AAC.1